MIEIAAQNLMPIAALQKTCSLAQAFSGGMVALGHFHRLTGLWQSGSENHPRLLIRALLEAVPGNVDFLARRRSVFARSAIRPTLEGAVSTLSAS
jgi:hypothetical protein